MTCGNARCIWSFESRSRKIGPTAKWHCANLGTTRCEERGPAGPRSSQRVVPKLAQCHFAVGPIFLDLDSKLQMHRALPQVIEFYARQPADFLQALPALADHDSLLTGALDPN